jgi:hypothetical protein
LYSTDNTSTDNKDTRTKDRKGGKEEKIPLRVFFSLVSVAFFFSGTDLSDGLITLAGESYHL